MTNFVHILAYYGSVGIIKYAQYANGRITSWTTDFDKASIITNEDAYLKNKRRCANSEELEMLFIVEPDIGVLVKL